MSTINTALNNIRQAIRQQELVAFCIHFWMPINNISMRGAILPQVPDGVIPGRQLLPIVELKLNHADSRLDPRTNKFVPVSVPYTVPIENSFTDMYRRIGQYGLVRVQSLDCTLDEAERYMAIFDQLMKPVRNVRLEQLSDYFEIASPIEYQLGPTRTPLGTTIYKTLDKLLASGAVIPKEYQAILAAIPEIAQSVVLAHDKALSPSGILPVSIREINAGNRQNFDPTDEWIMQQFPSFDSSSRISVKQADSQITKFAEVLANALQGQGVGVAPATATAPSAAPPVPSPVPEPETQESPFDSFPEQSVCEGTTKSGTQCKRPALAGQRFCPTHIGSEE